MKKTTDSTPRQVVVVNSPWPMEVRIDAEGAD